MNCDEECAADKTEAKEYAYFSGIVTGSKHERERIIKLIPQYMATVLSWGHETASKQLIALIKGEKK